MGFKGFSEEDGEPLYDTREDAIVRAKQMREWDNAPTSKIMIHRKKIPLWLAHLVQNTPLDWIGYSELPE